jgi:hypothetical protein
MLFVISNVGSFPAGSLFKIKSLNCNRKRISCPDLSDCGASEFLNLINVCLVRVARCILSLKSEMRTDPIRKDISIDG